jgi:hypothetical protein
MKCILIGHTGSQRIRKASEYLTKKYLPAFKCIYIEYTGDIQGWSKFLIDYLSNLHDEHIIFALDDYLIANYMDMGKFLSIKMDGVVCTKLCYANADENESYPVTTQYTLWDRRYLIELLGKIQTPWEFEMQGSEIFKKTKQKALFVPCLKYFTNSSLSARWEGVKLDGLSEEDVKVIQKMI